MIKGVILDVDGTLVDSNDAHTQAWRDALSNHSYNVSYDRIRELIGMGGDNLLPAAINLPYDSQQAKHISQDRKDIFTHRFLPQIKAFPATRDFVNRLHQEGIKVAVASSGEREDVDQLLKVAGVDDLIDDITSAKEAKNSKPDPDSIQAALDQLGLPPEQVVMIGDTPYDIQAAEKAGVRTVVVRTGGFTDEQLRGALAIYDNFEDLLAQFDQSALAQG